MRVQQTSWMHAHVNMIFTCGFSVLHLIYELQASRSCCETPSSRFLLAIFKFQSKINYFGLSRRANVVDFTSCRINSWAAGEALRTPRITELSFTASFGRKYSFTQSLVVFFLFLDGVDRNLRFYFAQNIRITSPKFPTAEDLYWEKPLTKYFRLSSHPLFPVLE